MQQSVVKHTMARISRGVIWLNFTLMDTLDVWVNVKHCWEMVISHQCVEASVASITNKLFPQHSSTLAEGKTHLFLGPTLRGLQMTDASHYLLLQV